MILSFVWYTKDLRNHLVAVTSHVDENLLPLAILNSVPFIRIGRGHVPARLLSEPVPEGGRSMVLDTRKSITEIATQTGFASASTLA